MSMSKNIKVTDEVYARLEEQAKQGYRPITSHLEFLLDYFDSAEKNKTENPKKTPSEKNQSGATGNREMPAFYPKEAGAKAAVGDNLTTIHFSVE